jgi:glycosyltransferase involved in cell wall biosynthesis
VKSLDLAKKIFDSVRLHPWDEKTCAQVIPACDLAVIPIDLSDSLVTGKPENKLLLLWRLGMPVVTSATPAYKRAMKLAGTEGLACRTEGEWVAALERMMDDESLRRDTGVRGRTLAETHYSESQMLARWDSVFASLGFSFQGGNR